MIGGKGEKLWNGEEFELCAFPSARGLLSTLSHPDTWNRTGHVSLETGVLTAILLVPTGCLHTTCSILFLEEPISEFSQHAEP